MLSTFTEEPPACADHLDAQLRRLAAIMAPLAETVNQHDARLARQDALNQRLAEAIERIDRPLAQVEMTQVRVETLLARMLRQSENGQDA